ncbi:MAG: hypothetical protein IPJ07_07580 [Acidobacteria bacterium]|nr:hypothetical protein [Acidobacteriota bacterium]
MKTTITVLPGDGIGVDVTQEAVACLETIGRKYGHEFVFETREIGGVALDKYGVPLPEETMQTCLAGDAVLLGAVGAPQYDNNPPRLKPETGLLGLRAGLGVFANLRPAFLHETLIDASPLKAEIVRGTDLLIVRSWPAAHISASRAKSQRIADSTPWPIPHLRSSALRVWL